MEWPEEFYEMHRGVGCPMCAEGRPDATPHGLFDRMTVPSAYNTFVR